MKTTFRRRFVVAYSISSVTREVVSSLPTVFLVTLETSLNCIHVSIQATKFPHWFVIDGLRPHADRPQRLQTTMWTVSPHGLAILCRTVMSTNEKVCKPSLVGAPSTEVNKSLHEASCSFISPGRHGDVFEIKREAF